MNTPAKELPFWGPHEFIPGEKTGCNQQFQRPGTGTTYHCLFAESHEIHIRPAKVEETEQPND